MKTMNLLLLRTSVCSGLLLLSATLSAQPAPDGGGPRKPPLEAVGACKSLSSGQDCNFTTKERTVKGSCWAPESKPLACRPKDAPQAGKQAPKKQ